jgi:uncharacterized membrane protein
VRTTLAVHIVAGALALTFGYTALFAAKGSTLHRKSGTLFVYAMVVMASLGAVLAALQGGEGSALPVLVVLVAMLYWLWRVRIRRSLRGIAGVSAQAA